jgi:hypothetical protein
MLRQCDFPDREEKTCRVPSKDTGDDVLSLFRDQAIESLLSLVSALMGLS